MYYGDEIIAKGKKIVFDSINDLTDSNWLMAREDGKKHDGGLTEVRTLSQI